MRINRFLCVAATAVAGVAVAGCCSVPEHSELTQIVVRPMPSLTEADARVAVDWVRLDDHSVVIRIDGYRHTLNAGARAKLPPMTYVPPNQAQPTQNKHTGAVALNNDAGRVTVNGRPAYADTPQEIAAWRAWCGGKEISEAQYEMVVGSRLPPDAPFDCDDFHRSVWRK